MEYKIKSAYKYYDEKMKIWNLFIFVEFCSVYFCIHRFRNDIKYLTGEMKYDDDIDEIQFLKNTIFNNHDVIYIYESNSFINQSILELKKKLIGIKKQNITKTLYKSIECFSCYSCNFPIYMLSCAYIENSENIIKNGIYADYQKVFWHENDIEILKNTMEYNKKNIITDAESLISKINNLINSSYNKEIF